MINCENGWSFLKLANFVVVVVVVSVCDKVDQLGSHRHHNPNDDDGFFVFCDFFGRLHVIQVTSSSLILS
jgi:hypothetical protein